MIIDNTDMSMVRGDSEEFTVEIEDDTLRLTDGDIVYFTVKKSPYDTEKIIQKVVTEFSNGVATISISPEDTKEVKYDSYWYDIQVTFKNGIIKTIIPCSVFQILPEVTYE